MVRRTLGWRLDLPEAERDAIKKGAARLVASIVKNENIGHHAFLTVAPLVAANEAGRTAFDALRRESETWMRKLAKTMPAYEWVASVPGFGELGFAVVIAEAGDIGAYANPAKLWKRLGLAVIRGQRQGRPGDNASADEWIEHGYNKRRRAEMFAFFSDAMLRAVWRGEKDGKPAHAIAHFGEVYGAKKAEYLARVELTAGLPPKHPEKWTPKRADMAARRYMTKRVLRDLWREWRKAVHLPDPVVALPDAASSAIETASSEAMLPSATGRITPTTKRRGRQTANDRPSPIAVSPPAGRTTIQPDAQP